MMKTYQSPYFERISISSSDIITVSMTGNEEGYGVEVNWSDLIFD